MKKFILLIILSLMFIPFIVDAKSKYLYDVLKNEAESGGLAKEYTGEHHDSFTEEPSKKIYHWYAENDTDGNQILEKNNVIFAGFCWQMIRTTDTGGVKIIYNGIQNNNSCNNNTNKRIAQVRFNSEKNSPSYVGYMFNSNKMITTKENSSPSTGSIFGNDVVYQDNFYSLINTSNNYDKSHHYTCNNTSGSCATVRYYYYNNAYIELDSGKKVNDVINDMFYSNDINKNNSTIKTTIDSWYLNNILNYSSKLEDTIYCSDRNITNLGGWNPNDGKISSLLEFTNKDLNNTNLVCSKETDKFSLSNELAKLDYPIGLMTLPEYNLINNFNVMKTGEIYWLMSPAYYATEDASVRVVTALGNKTDSYFSSYYAVRPVISLKEKTKYIDGNGSLETPFMINSSDIYEVKVALIDETKELNIDIEDITQVNENESVKFKVTPIKGYKVNSIRILDEEESEIEYSETGNKNEYTFVMPSSDVTIVPSYERVKSSVEVEENTHTKVIVIEVEDAKAVVYEDTVKFTITPEEWYEVDIIEIKDEEGNKIEYKKTNKENEYEFVMPDTNVTITPIYKKIESINVPNTVKNPNTRTGISFIIIFMLIISSITYIIFKRKKNYIMK